MIVRPSSLVTTESKVNNIKDMLLYALRELEGEFWECGVYQGGTAAYITDVVPNTRKVILFDSFEGVPEPNKEIDLLHFKKGDFDNCNYQNLQGYFSQYPNVKIIKGWIPQCFRGFENSKIAYCHLDVDLYQSYKDCLEFIWPRLVVGGVIIFDDYSAQECPGAKKAVDEFLADKKEFYTFEDFLINQHFIKKVK